MEYINVKHMADEILDNVAAIPNKKKKLCIISVGHDPASESYMKGKKKDCERVCIPCEHCMIANTIDAGRNLKLAIEHANNNKEVGGIILLHPLWQGKLEDDSPNLLIIVCMIDGKL